MNLELLGHDIEQNSRAIAALSAAGERTDARIEQFAQLVTGIVENHERRIASLETSNP